MSVTVVFEKSWVKFSGPDDICIADDDDISEHAHMFNTGFSSLLSNKVNLKYDTTADCVICGCVVEAWIKPERPNLMT